MSVQVALFDDDPGDDWTVRDAQKWLAEHVEEGVNCPVCHQRAKIYRRNIHATMAATAVKMYRHGGAREFIHTADLPGDTHEASELSWWGLIEEEKIRRPDGGRAGYWCLTPLGRQWVLGLAHVQRYAHVYDGNVLSHSGGPVSVHDALGEKFNYWELMNR
jgi:hypothetical protein